MNTIQFTHRGGIKVANHFIHETSKGTYFQSYRSVIAFIPKNKRMKMVLGRDWNYSNTTRNHLYEFLRDNGMNVHSYAEVVALPKVKFITTNITIA